MNEIADLIIRGILWYVILMFGYGILSPLYFPIKAIFGEENAFVITYILITIILALLGSCYLVITGDAHKAKKLRKMQEKLSAQSVENYRKFKQSKLQSKS